jgi:lactoylglutathione lyase
MIPIRDLFETHLTVSDLDRSVRFYRDALGLTVAHIFPERQVAFLWVGSPGGAMLGLWGMGSGPQRVTLHTAFTVSVEDVLGAPEARREAGITPLDFASKPSDEAEVLAWMPAVAVYFHDPDGNLLEFIAMLPGEARAELGVVRWSEWTRVVT